MAGIDVDVEAYAALAARLATIEDEAERARVLSAVGLDEDGWDALDDAWQERLSASPDEGDRVPELLERFAGAFARAQRPAEEVEPLPFERFVEATRELRRGVDMSTALDRLGLDLGTYLAAQAHWTRRMLADAQLAARFRDAMG